MYRATLGMVWSSCTRPFMPFFSVRVFTSKVWAAREAERNRASAVAAMARKGNLEFIIRSRFHRIRRRITYSPGCSALASAVQLIQKTKNKNKTSNTEGTEEKNLRERRTSKRGREINEYRHPRRYEATTSSWNCFV